MPNFAVPSDDVSVNTEDNWVPLKHPDLSTDEVRANAGTIVASNFNGNRPKAASTLSKLAVECGWAEDAEEVTPDFRYDDGNKRLVVSESTVNEMSIDEVEDMFDL